MFPFGSLLDSDVYGAGRVFFNERMFVVHRGSFTSFVVIFVYGSFLIYEVY